MAASYQETRAEAEAAANRTGASYGIERNPIFGTWRFWRLPRRRNRRGHEVTCEVVDPACWDCREAEALCAVHLAAAISP